MAAEALSGKGASCSSPANLSHPIRVGPNLAAVPEENSVGTSTPALLEDVMDAGLIGLGSMGTGIAKSLLRGGHRVTVYNRTRERAEALRKDGAAVAGSVAEACRGDAVLTMLADDAAVEAVVLGENGVLKAVGRGRVHNWLGVVSDAVGGRVAPVH